MKKIDLKKIIVYLLIMMCFCLLKKNYIYGVSNGTVSFVRFILAYWGENQLVNLIWFLPIMFEIYVLSKKYFYKLSHFDMRYRNRKKYVASVLLSFAIESFLFILAIAFAQLTIIGLFTQNKLAINFTDLVFVFQFIIENILLVFTIILFALLIKKLMYSLVVVIIITLVILTLTINLALIPNSIYIPFIDIYIGNSNFVLTAIIVLIETILIKKTYLNYDIGGMEE